jgi:septal ring factor EnvC (AmiA/AmiB activator)
MEGRPTPPPQPPAPPPVTGEQPVTTLEGLRAWIAQLDRKIGVRFYALGAAVVLALAAAIISLVLVLGLEEDSATREDVQRLRDEVADVQQDASQAADEEIAALSDRLDEVESQLQSLRSDQTSTDQRLSVVEDDITDLRNDISRVESQTNNGN